MQPSEIRWTKASALPDGDSGNAAATAGSLKGRHAALAEMDLATEEQRRRRNRILVAAKWFARTGGYGRVLMRDVAGAANVALGTLYRYFPSKTHMLVEVLARELQRFEAHASALRYDADDDYDRLLWVISALTAEMEREPLLTGALARGYVEACVTVDGDVLRVRDQLGEMLATLMAVGTPNARQFGVGQLLSDVWATHIVALNFRATTVDAVRHQLYRVVELVRQNDRAVCVTRSADFTR